MDGSDRKSVSSSSSSPLIKSKPSASDENNQSYHQKAVTKHFMSPTISAASKAIAPRKKVLAERNEISDTLVERAPYVDLKGTFSSVDVDKSDDSLSVNSESSLRIYDLPRSKFRRYKPNRGREIILGYENEMMGKKERLSSEEEIDMVSACQECFVKEESEEVDEREEGVEQEEEEEEEEREGFWRRVLKLLLVLVVLVVSTMYISSANSPTTLQAMEGVKEGCVKIHERFVSTMNFKDIVKFLEGGNEYLDGSVGLMKINKTVVYEGIGEVEEVVEDVNRGKVEDIRDNLIEIKIQDEKGSEEKEVVKDVYVGNLSEVVEVELLGGESEVEDEEEKNIGGVNRGKVEDIRDNLIEIKIQDEKGSEEKEVVKDVYVGNLSEVVEVELLGGESEVEDEEEKNIGGVDLGEIVELELLQGNQIPIVTSALPRKNEAAMEPLEENDLGEEGLEMVESEMAKAENVIDIAEDDLQEEGFIEHTESERIFKAVVGVTLFFAVVTSLVLALQLKRKRNNKKDDQSLVTKSCSNEYVVEDKCCSPIVPNEREDHIKPIDSFASPMPLINSSLMDFKELSQTRAPSIELLGEFAVGEMSSRSFGSSGMKSLKIESEVSSHSISLDNNKAFRTMDDFSEASAMRSQSYGHFTPEKKVSKKEEGIDGEAKKVVTTPLRRSSRLRNRPVQSP